MSVTNGVLPGDVYGTKAQGGYAPNVGVVAIQLGTVTNDAQGQPSAPQLVQQIAPSSVQGTLQSPGNVTGNGTSLAVLGDGSVILTVIQTGFSGTVTFQGSEDGTNYANIYATQLGTNVIGTGLTSTTVTSTTLWEVSCSGFQSLLCPITRSAGTCTIAAHAVPGAFSARVVNANSTNVGGAKATYTYAISATAPYATPTDWIAIRGSATKTVKIMRVEISGAATAATEVILTLNKHTVANTGGTSSTPTPMQHDSNDSAATATVLLYSVAPTISGTATIWKTVRMTLAVAPAATTVAPDRFVYNYAAEPYEPLVLRGVAQEFAINFAGAAVPSGGVYDVAITISEE
jgi:hypothetical protein